MNTVYGFYLIMVVMLPSGDIKGEAVDWFFACGILPGKRGRLDEVIRGTLVARHAELLEDAVGGGVRCDRAGGHPRRPRL